MTVSYHPARSTTAPSRGDVSRFCVDRQSAAIGVSLIAAFAGLLPSNVLAQHVHGVIDLGVVIEGETLAVSIDAPLSDVVGFEHAPGNDEQASRLKKAAAILASADSMFGTPQAAGCSASGTDITAPDYLMGLIAGGDGASAEHDDHKHDGHDHEDHDHEGHDHDGHDHDEHDHDGHDHSGEHAEVNATYQWTCSSPSELDAIALKFVSGFISVETVRVQLLTADGAQVMELGSDDRSLPLK